MNFRGLAPLPWLDGPPQDDEAHDGSGMKVNMTTYRGPKVDFSSWGLEPSEGIWTSEIKFRGTSMSGNRS